MLKSLSRSALWLQVWIGFLMQIWIQIQNSRFKFRIMLTSLTASSSPGNRLEGHLTYDLYSHLNLILWAVSTPWSQSVAQKANLFSCCVTLDFQNCTRFLLPSTPSFVAISSLWVVKTYTVTLDLKPCPYFEQAVFHGNYTFKKVSDRECRGLVRSQCSACTFYTRQLNFTETTKISCKWV